MRSFKNESGVTLIELAVTIVVLMILSISITASVTTTVEMKKYYAIKDDVIAIGEEIQKYYMNHNGNISELLEGKTLNTDFYETISGYSKDRNPNDNDNYYNIDISYFPDIDIQSPNSTYVFNEKSLTVYCVEGASLNNQIHYTMFTDFNEGGFAEDYYSDVDDLPITGKILLTTAMKQGKVSIGDFVNYSAGKWTDGEITALTNSGLYSGKNLPKSTTPYQFGGFAVGDSKDASITPYLTYANTYPSGWRVLGVDSSTGVVNLIHAGTPEGYFHPNVTNGEYKSEYILSGSKNASDSSTITNGVISRDWSMYANNTYATSAHCSTYDEIYTITDSFNATTNDLRTTGAYYWIPLAGGSSSTLWLVSQQRQYAWIL